MLTLLLLIGCGDKADDRVGDILALTGDSVNGELVFADACAGCHGTDGTGGSGPDLTGEAEGAEETAEYVLYGDGDMPAFDGDLSDQEIADVVAYVTEVLQAGAEADSDD